VINLFNREGTFFLYVIFIDKTTHFIFFMEKVIYLHILFYEIFKTMRSHGLIFVFLLFHYSNLFAQDWSLSPLNQKSYYKYFISDSSTRVEINVCDSVLLQGNTEVSLFGTKIAHKGFGNCYASIFGNGSIYTIFDSLFKSGDTIFFPYPYHEIYFLPNSQPGESWILNGYTSIKISCTSIILDTVLGIPDSVKIFSLEEFPRVSVNYPIDDYSIKLSKHYGLIGFLRFSEFKYHSLNSRFYTYFNLNGIQNVSGIIGYNQGSFLDWLPYGAGDILLWNISSSTNHPPSSSEYFSRDSIFYVYVSPDTFTYSYNRKNYNSGGMISVSSGTETYTLGSIGNLLTSFPYERLVKRGDPDVGLTDPSLWESSTLNLDTDTVIGGFMTNRIFTGFGSSFDTNTCSYNQVYQYYSFFMGFSDHLGITSIYDGLFNQWNHRKTLVAASLNGNVYGDISFKVGISDIENTIDLKTFPNPARDYIIFILPGKDKIKIELYGMDGKKVIVIENFDSGSKLNISDLPEGVYLTRISDKNLIWNKRIIKIDNK
jgi:hypothetical protein